MRQLLKHAVLSVAFALAVVAMLAGADHAQAAVIAWNPSSAITGDTDVSTLGTLDRAINLGGTTNAVVNGVTFVATGTGGPDSSYTTQNTTITDPGNALYRERFFSSTSAPYTNLSANYQNLLASAAYNGGNPMTVTLGGLTVGQTYQVQVWANDSRGGTRNETLNGGGNTVTLAYNVTNTNGGLGQFSIGTFVADATSQQFTLTTGTGSAQINALQLRNTTATPEPETWAMMGLGVGTLALFSWKRKRNGSLKSLEVGFAGMAI